jgi:hypothetical protein
VGFHVLFCAGVPYPSTATLTNIQINETALFNSGSIGFKEYTDGKNRMSLESFRSIHYRVDDRGCDIAVAATGSAAWFSMCMTSHRP